MTFMRILKNPFQQAVILGLCSLIAVGSYLVAANEVFRIGFPLDDAWIHQTYAKNLGEAGSWDFIPGQPSGGSTSPGWTLLLALGYSLKINPYLWTYLLGWLILWSSSVLSAYGLRILMPQSTDYGFWAGIFMIFEWHLIWAADSGMETLLAGFLALAVITWSIKLTGTDTRFESSKRWQWVGLGGLIGLSVWVRPDGITLLGIAALTIITHKSDFSSKLKDGLGFIAGVLLTIIPYLFFNLSLEGQILPNTFFAKQAEYAILKELPIWERYADVSKQLVTGVGVVLLPGFIWFIYQSIRKRRWVEVFATLWILGYLGLYALRLPVTYQHGRYIMPVMPPFLLFGFIGVTWLIKSIPKGQFGWIIKYAWVGSIAVTLTAFWLLGMRSYAMDVAVIESEMVETAHWIKENTGADSLIAAHDIGALGFFSDRKLVDLAGLVSPEVIPFIRDENALREHLNSEGADYLVTFPGWYPELTSAYPLIYQTGGEFSPLMGGENMAVYKWEQLQP